jgi:hypothetical protein
MIIDRKGIRLLINPEGVIYLEKNKTVKNQINIKLWQVHILKFIFRQFLR